MRTITQVKFPDHPEAPPTVEFPILTSTLLDSAAALENRVREIERHNQVLTSQVRDAERRAAYAERRAAYAVTCVRQLRRAHRNDSHAKVTRQFRVVLADLAPRAL